jgi:AbiV family abortive infection protein
MDKRQSALLKIRGAAIASFKNAVRLHEDAILLYNDKRFPSALHTSALSIEEIGKYFMFEDVWWHNGTDSKWSLQQIQEYLRDDVYSHTSKQRRFASQVYSPSISKPLFSVLQSGELEAIKQRATYISLPRKGKDIDFEKRMTSPSHTSKRRAEEYITLVNDFLIDLAVGCRKLFYILDIPEIDDWLAKPELELHFRELWPNMRVAAKRRIARMLEYEDREK